MFTIDICTLSLALSLKKKKKLSSSPNKRGKGNKLCKFKGQKCDEKEILETYGDVRKLLTWNV